MHALPLIRSVSQLRSRVKSWRAFGETVALIPTQGGLHEGHLSLIREARREADRVLATIFVDPLDRPEGMGLEDYAPTEERDAELLDVEGCDALYAPAATSLYPPGFATEIRLPGLTDVLCGEESPHRFDGWIRSTLKILNQAQADVAILGERDWQRLAIMRRLAADLDLPTKVVAARTERDMDDIALAAGVETLGEDDRRIAARLRRELVKAGEAISQGADVDETLDGAADTLADAGAEVEYLDLRDPETLTEIHAHDAGRPGRVFGAIHVGGLRLIDNAPAAPRE
jgi:pantoate--beta-alanine ligase